MRGERDDLVRSPDGLGRTVGERGDLDGDAGRLAKLSIMGEMGVLDGRGPGLNGSVGNGFATVGERSPV